MHSWNEAIERCRERARDAGDATRQRFVAWWERQQQPAWLRAARYRVRWQFEEWRWRFDLWWAAKAEVMTSAASRWMSKVAIVADRAGQRIGDRVAPLAHRASAWMHARSIVASERRATISTMLAELRDRRLEQLREVLGSKWSHAAGSVANNLGNTGLGWKHLATGCLVITAVFIVSWALREPPVEPFSEKELQLVRSFVRPVQPVGASSPFTGKLRRPGQSPPKN